MPVRPSDSGQIRWYDKPELRPAQARRLPGLADRVINRRQHVPGGLQQYRPRRSEPHALAAAPQHQQGADDLFQPLDLLAEGQLGDEQPLRGLR